MSQPIEGEGTPERAWLDWQGLAALPVLSLGGCAAALVVAPHPDDEVLGAGGVLVALQQLGASISLLALTDGEASHPHGPLTPAELGARRAAETDAAMLELLDGCPTARLGLPDGGLALCEDRIERAIVDRLEPGTWCIAPLEGDGHPDHEAAGRAASRACRRTGARLLEYPIWMWHWSRPGDERIPWERAGRVRLTAAAQVRKARAIRAFDSQIAPLGSGRGGEAILPPAVLQRFQRPSEVLFT